MANESTYRIGAIEVLDREALFQGGVHPEIPSMAADVHVPVPECLDLAAFKQGMSEAEAKGFDRGLAALSERIEQLRREYATSTLNVLREAASLLDEHYRQMEPRVIALSLDVAAKVLENEAKTEPLLAAGAVRSALDLDRRQMSFVLSVSPEDYGSWLSLGGYCSNGLSALSIKIDPLKSGGDCELQSDAGTLDLRTKKQLAELSRLVPSFENPVEPSTESQGAVA